MKNDTLETLKATAGKFGLHATVDRLNEQFDTWTWDNSYNWNDDKLYPTFEIRQKDGITFIWFASDQNSDLRYTEYLDENCFIFFDFDEFFDFIDEVATDNNEE